MKQILTVMLLMFTFYSFASNASSRDKNLLYPRLFVWPNAVEIIVTNNTDEDVVCSGTIFIQTHFNRFKTEIYYQFVPKNSQQYRRFPNFDFNDPYRVGYHSINCR